MPRLETVGVMLLENKGGCEQVQSSIGHLHEKLGNIDEVGRFGDGTFHLLMISRQ